jgi:uncharacterized delta-60 repeat protein
MRGRLSVGCIGVVAALLMATAPVASAAGGLDPSFGEGGLSFSPPGTAGGGLSIEVHAAPDGSATVSSGGSGIARFGPEGTWDSTYAGSGVLNFEPDPAAAGDSEKTFRPRATAVDSKGRLLVFGAEYDGSQTAPSGSTEGGPDLTKSEAMVFRFDADGSLDPTFGEGAGFVRYTFGVKSPDYAARAVDFPMVSVVAGTVDSKDRPVLALGAVEGVGGCYAKGNQGVEARAVARLTEGGLPDPAFGKGGVVPAAGTSSFPYLGIAGVDQPVVDVGTTGGREPECHPGATVIRLGENGARLGAFGSGGVRHLKKFQLALVEPSGGTVLTDTFRDRVELMRLGPGGAVVKSFGHKGVEKLSRPGPRHATVRPCGVDSQGRILMAGWIGAQNERGKAPKGRSALVVGRLLANGRPDPSFGEGGWIFTRLAPGVDLEGATGSLDSQGRLLVAGVTRSASETQAGRPAGYVLARYLLEG